MNIYYHNTTADNPNNMTLGYVTEDGDFLSKSEYKEYKKTGIEDPAFEPDIKIVVEEGLLSCGETIEEYCNRIAKIAFKKCA